MLNHESGAHIPLTLVRVSTGLLQADSGATRAECFFIVTSSDRRSSNRIDYIPKADIYPNCTKCWELATSPALSLPPNSAGMGLAPLPPNTLRYPPSFGLYAL